MSLAAGKFFTKIMTICTKNQGKQGKRTDEVEARITSNENRRINKKPNTTNSCDTSTEMQKQDYSVDRTNGVKYSWDIGCESVT